MKIRRKTSSPSCEHTKNIFKKCIWYRCSCTSLFITIYSDTKPRKDMQKSRQKPRHDRSWCLPPSNQSVNHRSFSLWCDLRLKAGFLSCKKKHHPPQKSWKQVKYPDLDRRYVIWKVKKRWNIPRVKYIPAKKNFKKTMAQNTIPGRL